MIRKLVVCFALIAGVLFAAPVTGSAPADAQSAACIRTLGGTTWRGDSTTWANSSQIGCITNFVVRCSNGSQFRATYRVCPNDIKGRSFSCAAGSRVTYKDHVNYGTPSTFIPQPGEC